MTAEIQNQVTRNYLPDSQNDSSMTQANKSDELTNDDFLKLLVTQLQYQDPLNPLQGTEFTAQLAQFTSLEQLYNINAGLDGLNLTMTSQNSYQAINLIGKTVTTAGQWINVKEAQPSTEGIYELETEADQVQINIFDQNGFLVRSIDDSAQGPGIHQIEWDGKDFFGKSVPDGTYAFEVIARNADGSIVNSAAYVKGKITGLTFDPAGVPVLLMNEVSVSLNDIIEIIDTESNNDT
ncbi:MAG: flagellar hook assembly protein FlgD [Deltaproteobacteria bacterium]|nr:flagellar hook assembly protein FlgD [Deltaproteobacteria bacterium]MBW2050842.1 flagellar hook assembly protein FlgD [Deltaproteobacteria bacterium]MBW2140066.1 flagellar hook assembly protein FlgD [Deltaproteobacteria bacterium]MBW2322068.1 flagellar hook assembly protein FlgD [Deltaproteobacteria bacterium]